MKNEKEQQQWHYSDVDIRRKAHVLYSGSPANMTLPETETHLASCRKRGSHAWIIPYQRN
jgi:hypothetical protein